MGHRCNSLDMGSTASLVYDPETYDDFPAYMWDARFDVDQFARTIEEYNADLWATVKVAICGKLGIPFQIGGCKLFFLACVSRGCCRCAFCLFILSLPVLVHRSEADKIDTDMHYRC